MIMGVCLVVWFVVRLVGLVLYVSLVVKKLCVVIEVCMVFIELRCVCVD